MYDPACGSGGMLIASANLLKAHGGRGYTLCLYGQEAVADTAGVARMNLFMHNLTQFQVEVGDTLKDPRFKKPDGSVATFDVIVANPPYSLKWKPWTSDPRAIGGVAPQSSADWAFVQHMIACMDPKKGRVGVVLPHGVLFRGGQEAAIRQRVLDDDLLEAVIGLPANLFYSTSIPTCILVFRAPGTKADERKDRVLFIDASRRFAKAKNRNVLTPADIADIVTAYQRRVRRRRQPGRLRWRTGGLAVRLVPMAEIAANGYDLNISRYLKQAAAEPEDLGTLIDAYNLARAERQKTEQRMLAVLADAGIKGFDE